jgi:hypothetical protein
MKPADSAQNVQDRMIVEGIHENVPNSPYSPSPELSDGKIRGMIKGGIAIPAGSSKYHEAQPCPRNSLRLRVKLHS